MDRAAVGLGAVFLHLAAELNFHQLFEGAIAEFSVAEVGRRHHLRLINVLDAEGRLWVGGR